MSDCVAKSAPMFWRINVNLMGSLSLEKYDPLQQTLVVKQELGTGVFCPSK